MENEYIPRKDVEMAVKEIEWLGTNGYVVDREDVLSILYKLIDSTK